MADDVTRRRGKELEDEILQAAWQLLNNVGYAEFTMGQTAKLAGTNKNAIYRRWPKKVVLVMSAMQAHVPTLSLKTPLTKNLRKDLIAALTAIVPIFNVTTPENIKGIVADGMTESGTTAFISAINEDNLMRQQTIRALAQFPNWENLTERQLSLSSVLLINEILQSGTLVKSAIENIVDEELLPVYLKQLTE